MKILNKTISFLIVLMLLFSGMSFAITEQLAFDDVARNSWYYEGVMTMAEYGVITGYPDGTFKPQEEVSREEFAVMMVRALQLGKNGSDSSFEDVDNDYWAVPYIEAAKKYLTGYKTNTGISFKPKYNAVREDMAVALVKALNYNVDNAKLNLLNKFKDKKLISENLKPYVAVAYEKRLIKGSQESDGLYFNPTKTLTRAEAAVLLLSVIREEKITFDEEKVVIEDADYVPSKLSIEVEEDIAYLKWNKIKNKAFKGYKVVVSKFDSTPNYPDNGYVRYITNADVTSYQLKVGQKANGSDFNRIESGERYYVTITTLFNDGKKTSNIVSFILEEQASQSYIRPQLKIEHDGDEAKLYWTKISHPNFKYYKVVVSEKDKAPKYPENGYMYAFSNSSKNYAEIEIGDKGNHSDFTKISSGKSYYVSISAVYEDRVMTSNVVSMILTEEDDYITPTLLMTSKGDRILLDWNKVDHSKFKGYKVVVSKEDDSPLYPDNGYMKYITNKDKTAFEVKVGDKAYNADFIKVEKDQWYYAAISVLYDDKTTVTNTVKFKIDQEVSNDYITPNLVVRDHGDSVELDWNRIDHAEFKGYKIVVSEDEEAPKYPDDGYMKYIVDKDITSFDIKEGMEAYNSDFNGISYNEEYYASITVLYKNGKTYSNTVAFELEEEDKNYIEPSLDLVVDEENSIAKLSWTRIDHSEFEGYKVVVSKSESTPEYPENGYVTYITDKNQSKFELTIGTKGYNSDFYKIEAGQKYYVAITAVYKDGKVTGNVENFELTVEAEEREDEEQALITPALEIHSLTERSVEFEWTTIDHNQFDGYKLVISKDDTRPSYPEDGYMTYITKAETHTFQVNIGDIPQRGDFKSIEQNVIYHATITALYGDDKLTSESVSFILSE